VRNQKKALSTSLRSATQATDSTCSGCSAKRNATSALGQRAAVMRRNTANSSKALSACSQTLVRWCHPLSMPKNWESAM
jgi:hypothetical protein